MARREFVPCRRAFLAPAEMQSLRPHRILYRSAAGSLHTPQKLVRQLSLVTPVPSTPAVALRADAGEEFLRLLTPHPRPEHCRRNQ